MSTYAPDDQRVVHNAKDANWREQEEQQRKDGAQPGDARQGYGNARDAEGQMEQDIATGDLGKQPLAQDASAQPGEISERPDEQLAADANRPLTGD